MAQIDRTVTGDRWRDEPSPCRAIADARSLTASDAAALLEVTPATLSAWERTFAFPASTGPQDGLRYPVAQLLALREALRTSSSVVGAVAAARRRLEQAARR